MAKKPQSTSSIKTSKADTATAKPEAAKPAADTATAAAADSSGSGKKASAPSRPISYFSAVASDEYRSGWDNIFGRGKKTKSGKPTKPAATRKRASALPLTITLDAEDLDAATRAAVEAVLRRHAKKKRLNYDRLAKNGQVSWQLSCRISGAIIR